MWAGNEGARVGSTGPSGAQEGGSGHWVGAGGAGLWEDCSVLDRHGVKAVDMRMSGHGIKVGGVKS